MRHTIQLPDILKPLISRGAAFGHLAGTSDRRISIGHLKLSYAAQRLFGIIRYPTHPERFRTAWSSQRQLEEVSRILEATNEQEWGAISDALHEVHTKTVAHLRDEYPSGKIRLQRRIRIVGTSAAEGYYHINSSDNSYGVRLCVAVLKAKHEGREYIPLDVDTLNGWCSYEPGAYGEILLNKEHSIEDVLMAEPYTERTGHLERDEWLVLNRNPSGELLMRVEDIDIPPEIQEHYHDASKRVSWESISGWQAEEYQSRLKPFFLLPDNRFHHTTPWFINWAFRLDQYLARRRMKRAQARDRSTDT